MTTLPNIPTDNLYKFMFISGLTLILSGIVLFSTEYNKISSNIDAVDFEIGKMQAESNFATADAEALNKQIDNLENKVKKINADTIDINQYINDLVKSALKDKNFREYLAFYFEHKDDLIPYYKQINEISEKKEQLLNKYRQIEMNAVLIKLKLEQSKKDVYYLIFLIAIVIVMINIGISLSVKGYKKWYTLVQKPIDEKIRQELLQFRTKNTE